MIVLLKPLVSSQSDCQRSQLTVTVLAGEATGSRPNCHHCQCTQLTITVLLAEATSLAQNCHHCSESQLTVTVLVYPQVAPSKPVMMLSNHSF
eukprot:4211403-Amphidinium_carterae.2